MSTIDRFQSEFLAGNGPGMFRRDEGTREATRFHPSAARWRNACGSGFADNANRLAGSAAG